MLKLNAAKRHGRPKGTIKKIHPTTIDGKRTIAYRKYSSMLQRCSNSKHPGWKYYGGKGIAVCDRWKGGDGYDNFVSDMGIPMPGMWIDRIDNAKGYEPSNCRWVTPKESCANRTSPGGPAIDPTSFRQRALAAGLPYMVAYLRVKTLGWTEERALSTPKGPRGRQPLPAP